MEDLDSDEKGFDLKLDIENTKVWTRFGSPLDKNSPTIKVLLTIPETDDPREVFEAVI